MVLHNDKWARKAKRANERRKGTSKAPTGIAQEFQAGDCLELNRPQALPDEQDESSAISSDSEDSFEFDSGDEGKTALERAHLSKVQTHLGAEASKDDPKITHDVKKGECKAENHTTGTVNKTNAKKYARRRLVDNSIRYEEAALDPYISVPDPEPDYDYHTMASKEFHNPTTVEFVPDEKKMIRTPLPMEDTAHFNQMRTMQQKEEYARDLRSRFGQRLSKAHIVSSSGEHDDDDFFQEMISKQPIKTSKSSNEPTVDGKITLSATREHEPLEKFLDDLLKI